MTELAFDDQGLVAGIVQDSDTREVLMLGYLNDAALAETERTRYVHFWSRSRGRLWKKGETSGNLLELVRIRTDCDGDAVLIEARPVGPTCHTGSRTCFEAPGEESQPPAGFAALDTLWRTISARASQRPPGSYTSTLLDSGVDGTARKVLEEAAEVVDAALRHARQNGPESRIHEEAADLVYHVLVLLAERRVSPTGLLRVLGGRTGHAPAVGEIDDAGAVKGP